MRNLLTLFLLLPSLCCAQRITISGYVQEAGSKENLPYVHIFIKNTSHGTYSNSYGFYSLEIPADEEVVIRFSSVGYQPVERQFLSAENVGLDVLLSPEDRYLGEVTIAAERTSGPDQIGLIRQPVETVKELPALLGEKDIIKVLQLQPGVKQGTEGSTALYVRGGGPGQNLFILDDAPVYNTNHLFGFLSVFNSDAIKSAEFWKGGFPARFGGRTSSVTNLQMREGNKEKIQAEGGVGLISSRLMVEGPLKKDKSSFLIAARRSYLDLLMAPFMSSDAKTTYNLHDMNIKLNVESSKKNRFFISGYLGRDKFRDKETVNRTESDIYADTHLGWGNATTSIRWNHLVNDKVFINTTALFSDFKFFLTYENEREGTNPRYEYSEYHSGIRDYGIKTDLDYFPTNAHHIKAGVSITHHIFQPRAFETVVGSEQNGASERYENQEIGAYIEDVFQISENSTFNTGLRLAGFRTLEKTYLLLEPRAILTWSIFKNAALNASYSRTNQFIHLLSNTGIGLSTDLWVPATLKSPPQQADLFSIGFTKKFPAHGWLLTVESYRKYMRNIIAYQEGATFLAISEGVDDINWENNITTGKGWSYGTEALIKKDMGKLTGWLGYTLSWTIHQFDDLNYGKRFYPKYDSRHHITLAGIYKPSSKVLVSLNWIYVTGNALTAPSAYYFANVEPGIQRLPLTIDEHIVTTTSINGIPYFGSRNSFRAAPYHRLDIGIQLHKTKGKYHRYWEFGLYNAYSRQNPHYYYLKRTNTLNSGQRISLEKRSLFPVLPFVSYNFKF